MNNLRIFAAALVIASTASAQPALSAGDIVVEAPDQTLKLRGGFGHAWIEANELVFDGGKRISHLIWTTNAPVFTFGAAASFGDGWTIAANGSIGLAASGLMKDYDWLAPHRPSYDFDDWTHRSVHPDTQLDRYIDVDLALGRDLSISDTTTLNLHGGVRYTNVRWTARGGSYIYSRGGFRDTVGSVPDGVPIISYEQRFPGVFLGAEATARHGAWTLSGTLRGGVTIGAESIDHHWRRNLLFIDTAAAVPFAAVGARIDYTISRGASLFLGGSFDRYVRSKADSRSFDIPSGAPADPLAVNGSGMDLTSVRVTAGVTVSF